MLVHIYMWWEKLVDWAYGLFLDYLEWQIEMAIWAFEYSLYIVWKNFDKITLKVAQYIAAIPKPAFLTNAESYICSAIENLSFGIDFIGPISLVVSALVFRFLLRRMPFIS